MPGDALKRIHWKATAHRDTLMVRQEEQRVNPRAQVWLEVDPSSQGTTRDRVGQWEYSPAFEWCVSAAASITNQLMRAGYVVSLQASAEAIDRHVAEGHDGIEDVLVDLATVEPQEDESPSRATAERVSFAVLGRLDHERARHWISTLSSAHVVLALVAHGTNESVLDLLHDVRWNVVLYQPTDDAAECWAQFDGANHAAT
jgi:uncharacterized protein (DUF58 family)